MLNGNFESGNRYVETFLHFSGVPLLTRIEIFSKFTGSNLALDFENFISYVLMKKIEVFKRFGEKASEEVIRFSKALILLDHNFTSGRPLEEAIQELEFWYGLIEVGNSNEGEES